MSNKPSKKKGKINKKDQSNFSADELGYTSFIFPSISPCASIQFPIQASFVQQNLGIDLSVEQTAKRAQQIISYINGKLSALQDQTYHRVSQPHEYALDIIQICLVERKIGSTNTLQYLEVLLKLPQSNLLEEVHQILQKIMTLVKEQKTNNLIILHLQVELAQFIRKAILYIFVGKNFTLPLSEADKYHKYWKTYQDCYLILDRSLISSSSSKDKSIFQKKPEIHTLTAIEEIIPYLNLERIKILNYLNRIENNGLFALECIKKVWKSLQRLRQLTSKLDKLTNPEIIREMLDKWELNLKIKSALQSFYLKNSHPDYQSHFILNTTKTYAIRTQNIMKKYHNQPQLLQVLSYCERQKDQFKNEIFMAGYECSLMIRTTLFHLVKLIQQAKSDNIMIIDDLMSNLELKIQYSISRVKRKLKLERPASQLEQTLGKVPNPQEQRQLHRNLQKMDRLVRKGFPNQNLEQILEICRKLQLDKNPQFELLKLYRQKSKRGIGCSAISPEIKYFTNLEYVEDILTFYYDRESYLQKNPNSPIKQANLLEPAYERSLGKKNISEYQGEKLVYYACNLENPQLKNFIEFSQAKDESKYYQFKVKRFKINLNKWHQVQKHPQKERQKYRKTLYQNLKALESSSDKGIKKIFPIQLIDDSQPNELKIILKQFYVPAQVRATTLEQCIRKIFTSIVKFILIGEQCEFLRNWYLFFTLYTFEVRNLQKQKLAEADDQKKFVFHAYCDQPILMSLLLENKEVLREKHPSFPLIDFILLIKKIREDPKEILTFKSNYEKQQFDHMINQVLAVQMESSNSKSKQILRSKVEEKFYNCPFFWSSEKKILEILNFRQRILNDVKRELRRKKKNAINKVFYNNLRHNQQSQQIIEQNEDQSFITDQESENNDRNNIKQDKKGYRIANQYHKSTQIFSLEGGILQLYAEEMNICNRRPGEKGYNWFRDKEKIKELILKTKKTPYNFKQQFPDHVRQLRNILAHTSADGSEKINLHIIQQAYPRLVIFIYKFKSYISKPLRNYGKLSHQNSIQRMFQEKLNEFVAFDDEKGNKFAVASMENINKLFPTSYQEKYKEFKAIYNIVNGQFLKKTSLCHVCYKTYQSLRNCASVWQFLHKVKHNNFELIFQNHSATLHQCLWLQGSVMLQRGIIYILKAASEFNNKKKWYQQMLSKTDYVPTSFLFQLLYYFPNLIDHLRYKRYLWDHRSKMAGYSNHENQSQKLQSDRIKSISTSKYRKLSDTN